jgi:hypothetical protein
MPNMVKSQAYIGNVNELVNDYQSGNISVTLVVVTCICGFILCKVVSSVIGRVELYIWWKYPAILWGRIIKEGVNRSNVKHKHRNAWADRTLEDIVNMMIILEDEESDG